MAASNGAQGHSLFVKNNGTLWAMGYNYNGQLGDGAEFVQASPNGADRPTPVYVAGGNGPYISTQPAGQTVTVGSLVTFGVIANGSNLTYQWQKNSSNIPGATSASYTIANVQESHAGSYRVIVNDAYGSSLSNVATLTVNAGGGGNNNGGGGSGGGGGGGGAPSLLWLGAVGVMLLLRRAAGSCREIVTEK